MLICNTLLQSRIITAATTIVPWCFQCQFWGVFTSAKDFFFQFCLIRSTHPEIFFNEIGNIHPKVFFKKIAVLNILGKFPEKHQWQSSYSAYLWAFNIIPVVNDFLGIFWKFSEQLFQRTQVAGCFFPLIIP